MTKNRTRNATRNLFWGVVNKLIGIIFPFICRTVLIYTLGTEYLGLNSLFTSILSVLSLAELGFGSALVFSMYQPIAQNDTNQICALLNFYKKIYRIIGSIILVLGIALIPLLDFFISGEIPRNINITVIYIINLLGTVISYFLFAYKNSLLIAHQRVDIISNIASILYTAQYLLQIILLFLFKNYYLYLLINPILVAVNNIITAIIVTRKYPEYQAKGKIDNESKKVIKKKVSALFLYKIGNIVSNSIDTIIISSFLGISMVAIYGNYYYIISSLFGILSIYYNSLVAGIANSLVLESVEKNFKDFNRLFYLQCWIIGWCTICLVCLYQPFIKLWVGKERMLPFSIVISLAIYFYTWKIQDIVYTYKDAAGMWDKDRYLPLISAVINLTLNIITVKVIGLHGVIFSTIIVQLLINGTYAPKVLFDNYFKVSMRYYYISCFKYFLLTTFLCFFTLLLCQLVQGSNLMILIGRGIICIIFPNLLMVVLSLKNDEFHYWKKKIGSSIQKMLNYPYL